MAIFRTGHMGDTVCAIPAFRLVRRYFANGSLSLVCDAPALGKVAAKEIAQRLGIFDRIETYRSEQGWRTLRDLFSVMQRLCIDVLVNLPQLHKSRRTLLKESVFFRLAGVGCLYGFRPSVCRDEWQPTEADRLVQMLNEEGIGGEEPVYDIPNDREAAARMAEVLRGVGVEPDRPYVVFCGGGKAPTQRWGLDRYAAVLEEMHARTGWPLVAIGSREDVVAYRREFVSIPRDLSILAEPMCMGELIELVRRAACYVGNDTGPMHLAAAVGCPVIAVMSARNKPGQWDPDVTPNMVIRHRTKCEGCWGERCPCEEQTCLSLITADEVIARAVPFLESLRPAP